ncbi:MAG: 16S rRNA (adenine(1518)-N(6)/adenine(1519)-N(6))-dimethyltransferase RsmA [Candidatus Kapabacteria bacterium]|nr:16S rRNA (adenine(1518)-N(6)/adenine(1519)-N(6))-dimethyltransferase RsmA [Candidatus Kapabacteria bacterium]
MENKLNLIQAKKSLGQNFLVDENIAKKIVDSLKLQDNDFVIEIGPGTGALTRHLVKYKNIDLTLIEIDERAVEVLIKDYGQNKINIISSDFLALDLNKINSNGRKIKVVGNLPYYIASQIIFKILENSVLFEKAVFMLQKEMAQRIISKHGNKVYGIMSVALAICGKASILFDVAPGCFLPKPKVTSSVLEVNFLDKNLKYFEIMKIVKLGFNQRRKMLRNALHQTLSDVTNYEQNEVITKYLTKRAEQLSLEDFIILSEEIIKGR